MLRGVGQRPVPANGPGGGATAAPSTTPAGVPQGAGPAGGDDGQDRSAEINGNYDATLEIYQTILDKQGTDPANIDRRIQANEEIILKVGQASIDLKKDGTITVKGKDITVQGSGEVKGNDITLKGSGQGC